MTVTIEEYFIDGLAEYVTVALPKQYFQEENDCRTGIYFYEKCLGDACLKFTQHIFEDGLPTIHSALRDSSHICVLFRGSVPPLADIAVFVGVDNLINARFALAQKSRD